MFFHGRQNVNDLDLSLLATFVRKRMTVTEKSREIELQKKELEILRGFDEKEMPLYTEHEEKQPLKE